MAETQAECSCGKTWENYSEVVLAVLLCLHQMGVRIDGSDGKGHVITVVERFRKEVGRNVDLDKDGKLKQ